MPIPSLSVIQTSGKTGKSHRKIVVKWTMAEWTAIRRYVTGWAWKVLISENRSCMVNEGSDCHKRKLLKTIHYCTANYSEWTSDHNHHGTSIRSKSRFQLSLGLAEWSYLHRRIRTAEKPESPKTVYSNNMAEGILSALINRCGLTKFVSWHNAFPLNFVR